MGFCEEAQVASWRWGTCGQLDVVLLDLARSAPQTKLARDAHVLVALVEVARKLILVAHVLASPQLLDPGNWKPTFNF